VKQLIVTRHDNGRYSCTPLTEPIHLTGIRAEYDCSVGNQCEQIGGAVWRHLAECPELTANTNSGHSPSDGN